MYNIYVFAVVLKLYYCAVRFVIVEYHFYCFCLLNLRLCAEVIHIDGVMLIVFEELCTMRLSAKKTYIRSMSDKTMPSHWPKSSENNCLKVPRVNTTIDYIAVSVSVYHAFGISSIYLIKPWSKQTTGDNGLVQTWIKYSDVWLCSASAIESLYFKKFPFSLAVSAPLVACVCTTNTLKPHSFTWTFQ